MEGSTSLHPMCSGGGCDTINSMQIRDGTRGSESAFGGASLLAAIDIELFVEGASFELCE